LGASECRKFSASNIEPGAKNAALFNRAVEDALRRFDNKRRRKCVDIAPLRDYTACFRPFSGDHIHHEDLRRTPGLVGWRRWRCSRIAQIAQWRKIEIGAERLRNSQQKS
jgi:hypothetical protein